MIAQIMRIPNSIAILFLISLIPILSQSINNCIPEIKAKTTDTTRVNLLNIKCKLFLILQNTLFLQQLRLSSSKLRGFALHKI